MRFYRIMRTAPFVGLICSLLFQCGCTSFYSYQPLTTAQFVSSPLATNLIRLLDRIEHGDAAAWRSFRSYRGQLDGEHGETYSVACAELWCRDPAFYLRQYLDHPDDPEVLHVAAKGYAWSAQFKSTIDRFLFARLNSAPTITERQRIQSFIGTVTARKFSADE